MKLVSRVVGIALAAATLSVQCITPFPASLYQPMLTPITAKAEELTSGDFKYSLSDDGVVITGYTGSDKEITIPDSINEKPVTTIGSYAFKECKSLVSVDIPESVKSIGQYAFQNNDQITSIDIPSSVESIGQEAFAWCDSLAEITLHEGLKDLGYLTFAAAPITEIYIPATIEKGRDSFKDCGKITTAKISQDMIEVPYGLFQNCGSLRTVYLPDTVKQLGDYAFANCTSLSSIIGGAKDLTFKPHTFENCESLFDHRFTLLDPNSYLTSNADLTSINGMVNYTVKYQLRDSIAKSSQNHQVRIEIPEGMTIIPESISSNVIDKDATDLTSGVFYVTKPKGIIKFSCRILEHGDYSIAARLSFNYNGEWWTETIGTLDVEVPDITCSSVGTTNNFSIDVHGIAEKGADVELYIDGKKEKTIQSNEYTGKYSTTLLLPEKESGSTYSIYAQCGKNISDEITVTYEENKPAIKKVWLIYNDHKDERLDITTVFTEGASPVLNYNPAYPMVFEIEADHNDQIFKMYVTSTKGKDTKYLEAKWNVEKQLWITNGVFDPDNPSYVPGSLNISIVPVQIKTYEELDTAPKIDSSASDKWIKNSSYETVASNDNETLDKITLSDGRTSALIEHYYGTSDEIIINNKTVTKEQIASSPGKYGYSRSDFITIEDGKQCSYFYRTILNDNCTIASDFFEFATGLENGVSVLKIIEGDHADSVECIIINELWSGLYDYATYDFIAGGLDPAGVAVDVIGASIELLQNISKAQTDEQKTAAAIIFAGRYICAAISVMLPFPYGVVFHMCSSIVLDLAQKYLDNWIETGDPFFLLNGFLRFILDPSGYVYEAIDSNRIKDAKLTIYYKDSESDEALLWNAEDYDQSSTLYSASDGSYAWDVPEGLWKVVCEKEGYDTVESEWVNVPPVQTDINFSIVSHDVPAIIETQIANKVLTVTFSKYMIDKSVSNDSIQLWQADKQITCTIKPVKEQGNNSGFSNTYQISTTEQVNWNAAELKTTADAKSYAGVSAADAAIPVTNDTPLRGDVDGDGTVSVEDAQLALKSYTNRIAGNEIGLTEDQIKAADVNDDGELSVDDAQNILIYYVNNTVAGNHLTWDEILGKKKKAESFSKHFVARFLGLKAA